MPDPRTPEVVQFGVFEANLATGELRRNGSKVRLQEQPFQVLALLLAQPGQIVTREELHARLWPANTFVDFDHGLNAAIKRLRDALGDSAENPRFVETLARRGYRFLVPVVTKPPIEGNSDGSAKGPPSRVAYRRWRIALCLAAVLLIGISTGWHAGHRSAAASRLAERPLTSNPENDPVLSAAISPDGKYVAFVDRSGAFLRVVSSGETHALVLPEALKPSHVSWFPDGSHILLSHAPSPSAKPGFSQVVLSNGLSSLWSASIFGGTPQKLMDNTERGAVSPDGSQIVFLRGEYGREEIWRMQADGQQPRKILGEPGDHFESVVWSPDSRHVAFVRTVLTHGWLESEASLGICDPVTTNTKYILSSARLRGTAAWSSDGRLVYSLGELPPNQNDSNLWAIRVDSNGDRAWGEPTRLTTGPDAKETVGISADGKRLLFLRRTSSPEVFVADAASDGTHLGTPRRLSLEERRNLPFAWTVDNKSVIFVSDRDGPFHIFKQSPDQSAPDLLVGGDRNAEGARLTPDGSEILYLLFPPPADTDDRRVRLMRMPVSGGTPREVLTDIGITNVQCGRAPSTVCLFSRFSPNGLVFVTFDPASGKEKEVTRIEDQDWYAYNWTLSPDGSTLALSKKHRPQDHAAIRLLPVAGGTERTITADPWSGIAYMDWAADGRSIWVRAVSPAGVQTLLSVDLHGKATPALQESDMELGWAIPSPDGRRVAIWKASDSSNAWVLDGF